VITPDGVGVYAGNINSWQRAAGAPNAPDAWRSGGLLDFDSNADCRSDGSFASDRSDVPEGADSLAAVNTWTAPARPGRVFLWAVLRDSRGGATFVQRELDVE
jgi:hypothetical protein